MRLNPQCCGRRRLRPPDSRPADRRLLTDRDAVPCIVAARLRVEYRSPRPSLREGRATLTPESRLLNPPSVPDRFYAPVSFAAPVIELSRDESQHLASVLRKSPGDAVVVFDGRGNAAEGVVETVGKRTASVRIVRQLPMSLAVSPH